MRRVILESPYAGATEENIAYACRCMRGSLARGEAPFASHLLYTHPGILDDMIAADRMHGIAAGQAWLLVAEACVVHTDMGVSEGMACGIVAAQAADVPVEHRTIGPWLR
ncbi:MAG: hypothetical protein ACREC4_03715 [Methylocella sp.]